jgi:hypothetical protein
MSARLIAAALATTIALIGISGCEQATVSQADSAPMTEAADIEAQTAQQQPQSQAQSQMQAAQRGAQEADHERQRLEQEARRNGHTSQQPSTGIQQQIE